MHPIKRFLVKLGFPPGRDEAVLINNKFGFQLGTAKVAPKEFVDDYKSNLTLLKSKHPELTVYNKFCYDVGQHPASYIDYHCSFASYWINKLSPDSILDIGSYRSFIIGLTSHYKVTSVDCRSKKSFAESSENIIVCDAKNICVEDNSFDVVISLFALAHFGLGRYGDEFDIDADRKAFKEFVRVLKVGGHLIFTTTINKNKTSIVYNAHRIYSYEDIHTFCSGLTLVDERFYDRNINDCCSLSQIPGKTKDWGIYHGCWVKNK